jgi:hypothetical protein
MYVTKRNTEERIALLTQNAALNNRYEGRVGTAGKPYFVLPAATLNGIVSMKRNSPPGETVDISALARLQECVVDQTEREHASL